MLPDTSIWVDYLRTGAAGSAAAMQGLLEERRVITCGPVTAELLAGARGVASAKLGSLLDGLRWAPIDRPSWHRVGEVAAMLRAAGTRVPLTDIVIAVAGREADAEVWTRDSDFLRIQRVLPELMLRPI